MGLHEGGRYWSGQGSGRGGVCGCGPGKCQIWRRRTRGKPCTLMGETSIRADRDEFNGGVLSDLTVPSGALDCNNGAGALVAGMTSGARRFGDMALAELATGVDASSMTLAKKSSSSSSSVAENGMAVMARSGLVASSGALMERSWRAGLPGIVAVHSVVSNIIVKINSAGSCRT